MIRIQFVMSSWEHKPHNTQAHHICIFQKGWNDKNSEKLISVFEISS